MNRIINLSVSCFILSLFVWTNSLWGQEEEKKSSFFVDKAVIDYGQIKKGSDGTRFFTLTNNSKDTPLIIKNAVGSCGCTVPTYPKAPIAPGKEAKIKVKYDTQRLGAFKKSVTLYTNAEEGQKVLYIKGEVIDK